MGKVVQPLQSVNCHDSRAHGLERHGPFTRLVEYGWFGCGQVMVFATGVRPMSIIWSGYRGETCKQVALGYSLVTEVQCHT
jgi:hypothetical protein